MSNDSGGSILIISEAFKINSSIKTLFFKSNGLSEDQETTKIFLKKINLSKSIEYVDLINYIYHNHVMY
jgi:hypothetical protein